MLNLGLGSSVTIGDRELIATDKGAVGHAVYGPYEKLEPGRYSVAFDIALGESIAVEPPFICAVVDVVSDEGRGGIAFDFVSSDQIHSTRPIVLEFVVHTPREVEYRVHVNGTVPLRIADKPVVTRLGDAASFVAPTRTGFFDTSRQEMRRIYDMGASIYRDGASAKIRLNGVMFHANKWDDINFVHEIFVQNAYNFVDARECCVLDVGMNVALASLQFARRDTVKEIHAFEPFDATWSRGLENIALNSDVAGKISVYKFGLGDADEDVTLRIHDNGDSGGLSTRDAEGGVPMQISMKDAGSFLRPIVESAKRRGLRVVAKIDCEGAEFPIFRSLEKDGLFSEIDVLMVEWHRVFEGKTQAELFEPLLKHDFVVFDVSPPTGNGFFYAARNAGS